MPSAWAEAVACLSLWDGRRHHAHSADIRSDTALYRRRTPAPAIATPARRAGVFDDRVLPLIAATPVNIAGGLRRNSADRAFSATGFPKPAAAMRPAITTLPRGCRPDRRADPCQLQPAGLRMVPQRSDLDVRRLTGKIDYRALAVVTIERKSTEAHHRRRH